MFSLYNNLNAPTCHSSQWWRLVVLDNGHEDVVARVISVVVLPEHEVVASVAKASDAPDVVRYEPVDVAREPNVDLDVFRHRILGDKKKFIFLMQLHLKIYQIGKEDVYTYHHGFRFRRIFYKTMLFVRY